MSSENSNTKIIQEINSIVTSDRDEGAASVLFLKESKETVVEFSKLSKSNSILNLHDINKMESKKYQTISIKMLIYFLSVL